LKEFQKTLGTALRVMVGGNLPAPGEIQAEQPPARAKDRLTVTEIAVRRKTGELTPTALIRKAEGNGTVVVWVHPDGLASLWDKQGKLNPDVSKIIDSGADLLAVEVLRTGSMAQVPAMEINKQYAGYTFGYNRPLLASRVRDIQAAVAAARDVLHAKRIFLLGLDKAGPWVALARGVCGDAVSRTAADLNGFRFENITNMDDDMMLPGALKYGGLPVLTALSAPAEIYLYNASGSDAWPKAAYAASGQPGNLQWRESSPAPGAVEWLLR
jgi:hypothetical protein